MTLFRLTKISILSCLLSAFCQVTSSYAIDTKAKHSFMIDMNTHTVLMNKAGDELMPPSSMSKLMTIYILFSRLAEGRVKLDSKFTVSEKAWRTQGSKTFVGIGSEIAVEDLIHGITTQSGNDACVVVAEGLSGTEEAFAAEMNRVAKTIGLEHSHFINATGLPDDNHIMTARDLATLAERLIVDFPQYYHYFSTREYTYNNIKQQNRNRLLGGSIGVDGLKTGHTEAGGYGITLSALQEGRRLILVVNGLESDNDRVEEGEKLMRWGFREFENKTLLQKGQVVADADVWFGKSSTVALTSDKDIVVTLPANMKNDVKFILKYNAPLPAPITKGTHVADLVINIPGSDAQTIPLLANDDIEKLSGFSRMSAVASYYLHSSK